MWTTFNSNTYWVTYSSFDGFVITLGQLATNQLDSETGEYEHQNKQQNCHLKFNNHQFIKKEKNIHQTSTEYSQARSPWNLCIIQPQLFWYEELECRFLVVA